ncbi:PREDICTED: hybrid signal transduction histidine kinase M [Drosophila arizonae]|uniref:Hybrid signal transduction histidine kinase M n=1 Tax=Drosophila arizonae TaxID=7263 RepID=A0ABM1NT79_DROAR|nr:PREDICTED: hybrid signal transduction histidine kinase M [Drosophila arizonae]
MIKFVRHKNRENSLKASKNFLRKKRESNDSGTESDGELLDVENKRHLDVDMETSLSSCTDANSPTTDTACSSESSAIAAAAMMCHHQTSSSSSCAHLMYDQHSSEEELEVINGPSAVAAAEAAAAAAAALTATIAGGGPGASSASASRLSNRGCSSSLDTEAPYDERATTSSNSKRSSSTLMVENRKRSLAHSSDDELRNLLEPILTPVNFRTSPPLEAFKPNRSHMMFRSTTPLILSEARCGIENIKLCDNSVNEENGDGNNSNSNNNSNSSKCAKFGVGSVAGAGNEGNENEPSAIKACSSSLKMSNSSHHIYQPQPKYSFHYNSSRSSPASTTGLDMEVRSVSPPAKLFHCAISPHRRPSNNVASTGTAATVGAAGGGDAGVTVAAATQRLQRPHRPCLDFDKMQQVSL